MKLKQKLGSIPLPSWFFLILVVCYNEWLLHFWITDPILPGRLVAVTAFAASEQDTRETEEYVTDWYTIEYAAPYGDSPAALNVQISAEYWDYLSINKAALYDLFRCCFKFFLKKPIKIRNIMQSYLHSNFHNRQICSGK